MNIKENYYIYKFKQLKELKNRRLWKIMITRIVGLT
jgi:hypothetical protein